MKTIPTQSENPKGLHQRYYVEKTNGEPIDPEAEYFVLRVDLNGSDPKHIAACRKAVIIYANEIKDHLPELSKDLIERYGDHAQFKEQPMTDSPSDEAIERHYPTESGESVIMQSYMSYNDTLKANYFRREGAKAMRDGKIK